MWASVHKGTVFEYQASGSDEVVATGTETFMSESRRIHAY
jgi:hypothetical protein